MTRLAFYFLAVVAIEACGDSPPPATPAASATDGVGGEPVGTQATDGGGPTTTAEPTPSVAPIAAPAKAAILRLGKITIVGKLGEEAIKRAARDHLKDLQPCYAEAAARKPDLVGRVGVKMEIDTTGAVTSAKDGGSDVGDADMISCVVAAFQKIEFPRPRSGKVTSIVPIMFEPDTGDAADTKKPGAKKKK